MANLIKGQLLKHLSKFFKNLSADSFNLSTIKGQCDLYHLELNEAVLMDLLEFPVWLNISRATCNRVTIRIPWTKLKTLPIQFLIDEVIVNVETCEEFRKSRHAENLGTTNSSRKYGYVERLIEGIRVSINSIVANFSSYKFHASFQLSHLIVESRTPAFKPIGDLRLTRIKDEIRGQILTFKHIEWQTLKLEAKSETGQLSTPLRLITSRGSCRITIKKQLSDCQVLAARIIVIFDDLKWVLTDAMLLSAFHLVTYLNSLIQKSPITKKAVEDTTPTKTSGGFMGLGKSVAQKTKAGETSLGRFFADNDVPETSYHLYIKPLELYLCDDLNPKTGRSCYPPLADGGCLHVIFSSLVINLYPYHKCLSSRQNWLQSMATATEVAFVYDHLHEFAEKLKNKDGRSTSSYPMKKEAVEQLLKGLLSLVTVVRISDYTVEMVSTNSSSGKGRRKQDEGKERRLFIKTCALPNDMPAFYFEMNQFYYYQVGSNRASLTRAAPQPTAYLQIAPTQLTFDPLTVLWVNAFYNNLHNAIIELKSLIPSNNMQTVMHTRVELLMPTLVVDLSEGTCVTENNTNYHSMEIKCTRILVTNDVKETTSLKQLNGLMELMGTNSLLVDRDSYPWINEVDTKPVTADFIRALENEPPGSAQTNYRNDVWVGKCDPFWIEFREKQYNRLQPFVDPLQVSFWVFVPNVPKTDCNSTDADVSVLLNIQESPKINIDHSKFVYLMRVLEQLDAFNDFMTKDNLRITSKKDIEQMSFPRISISTVVPDVQILLILQERWNRTKSVGTSACTTPLRSPLEDYIVDNFDSQGNLDSISVRNAVIEPDVGDVDDEPTVSIHRTDGNSASLAFHKPLKSEKSDGDSFSRTRSYSTLASTPTDLSPLDDDNRSDFSGDSDNFVVLDMENIMSANPNDLFLSERNQVEEATEASQASEDSGTHSSDCREVPMDVTFLSVNIASVALVKQGRGFHSSMMLNCSGVSVKEWLRMPFEEYRSASNIYSSFGSNTTMDKSGHIRIRMDAIAKPDEKKDLLSIHVEHLTPNVDVDTITLISDFVTDPDCLKVTPMFVLLTKFAAQLNDPKVKVPPTVVSLDKVIIKRNAENVLQIGYKGTSDLLRPHRDLLNDYSPTRLLSKECPTSVDPDLVKELMLETESLVLEIKKLKEENHNLKQLLNSSKSN